MRAIGLLLLFLGAILITKGVYQNGRACPPAHTEVRFIPRTLYDEQLVRPSQDAMKKGAFATEGGT